MKILLSIAAALLLVGLTAMTPAQTDVPDANAPPAPGAPALPEVLPDVPAPGAAALPEPEGQPNREGAGGPTRDRASAPPPASTPEEYKGIPALLSLERKVQLATACQYWVKLHNRLPFKIRNLALYFEAYIWEPGYDHPLLFDSTIKSFSDLRSTDSQYRDIFFQNSKCDRIAYIQVEDAGRRAIGALTKFSAQSATARAMSRSRTRT